MPRRLRGSNPSTASLVGVAILVGILVGFGLSTAGFGVKFQYRSQSLPGEMTLNEGIILEEHTQNPLSAAEIELRYLTNMVAKTNGFYARDYSLWLGWNNMRYIIETAVLHGRILNRTTIIPSFVYARACEFTIETCAAYATMVNRGDAVHSDEWRGLPTEQQMAWRIPISLMFNLTHLQQSHAVITTEDYLRLHNISADIESTDGQWNVDTYHVRDTTGDVYPSLHTVDNELYDPDAFVRVDSIPEDMRLRGGWSTEGGNPFRDQPGSWAGPTNATEIYDALTAILPLGRPLLNWDDVQRIVTDGKLITPASSEEEISNVLRENGFEVVYTYDGRLGMEYAKDVIIPGSKAVPRHRIRGLYEDFHNISAWVLLMRGELHLNRKPGSLFFTSAARRSRFTRTVLYDMRLTEDILSLSEQVSDRMFALTGGRLWMAAHIRRGDFARYGWAMEGDFGAHFARIKRHLDEGQQILVSMHGGNATVYDVPGAHPNPMLVTLDPPQPDDKYYIATDERDPDNLQYLRDHGAVLISDLLTQEDRRACGWPIMLTDVLALVEQSVLSHAAYFYAQAISSVAGGAMNMRAGLGMDPRTGLLD